MTAGSQRRSDKPGSSLSSRLLIHTTWGSLVLYASSGKLVRCELPFLPRHPLATLVWKRIGLFARSVRDARVLLAGAAYLHAALRGRACRRPSLDLSSGTPFQQNVWRQLLRIPRGALLTYAEVAEQVSSRHAARAVGNACRANPLPLFVPCHRVVARSGDLGGFSAGLGWKRYLLAAEKSSF